ncbi:hypothetical protein Btru_031261 [Bulinus truncatus]|nr:hypothetical protein Btru_031261 [Bulinus truncatus]
MMDSFIEMSLVREHSKDVFTTFGMTKGQLLMATKNFVYLAHRKENSFEKKVVKIFKRTKNSTRRFHTEVGIMKKLNHHNIMVFEEAGSFPRHHAMILPYCGKGAMYNVIGKTPFHLAEDYFLQIVSAVKYLHGVNIVHRDIKLGNILVDDSHRVFLTDFDLSCSVVPGNPTVERMAGTKQYMAPEMIMSPEGSYDGFKLDIYSLGVVLLCLIFDKDLEDREDYLDQVITYNWESLGYFYKFVLQSMLEDNPDWRWDIPSLIAALEEAPWLADRVQTFILYITALGNKELAIWQLLFSCFLVCFHLFWF